MHSGHFAYVSLALQAYLANVGNALIEPVRNGTVADNEYIDPSLNISATAFTSNQTGLPANVTSRLQSLETKFGLASGSILVDDRSGRVANLFPTDPIIPGDGVGNTFAPRNNDANDPTGSPTPDPLNEDWSEMAVAAVKSWLTENALDLDVDVSELFAPGTVRTAVHGTGGDLIQLNIPRTFKGMAVVGSRAAATVKGGNLISIGFESWGAIPDTFSVVPTISVGDARNALATHAGVPLRAVVDRCTPELTILTLINGNDPSANFGNGYMHALVWKVCPEFVGQTSEDMEGYVHAGTGQVLRFIDTVEHLQKATGFVYPLTNDGIAPLGMSTEAPMSFMTVDVARDIVTDKGGNFISPGPNTVSLSGPYVKMVDRCGKSKLIAPVNADILWGGNVGTDCDTSGFAGAGNTHASRTGFHELNKMMELARSHLNFHPPKNNWLERPLTAEVNNDLKPCDASYSANANKIAFSKSSLPIVECANTGEIAHLLDHEWGHGMDYNDLVTGISEPSGDGIADIYAALRHADSCIGPGFRTDGILCEIGTGVGGGVKDDCTFCTGVRELDFTMHNSGLPHTYTWMIRNCVDHNNAHGYDTHCMGNVYSEAIWSLYKRELKNFYNYDDQTSLEIVQRLTYIAAGNVKTWFNWAGPLKAGCGPGTGYMSFLEADDDDGDLTNGTPHMEAIYKAFNDQQIACDNLAPQNSGCQNNLAWPNQPQRIVITPGYLSVTLTWPDVPGATSYQIFRADGAKGCNQGKVLLDDIAFLTYTDTGLSKDHDYYYIVIPKGKNPSCFGLASSCVQGTPDPNAAPPAPWYVDWASETCVQDCAPAGKPCLRRAKFWEPLFPTATQCCQTKLSYKHLGWCVKNSEMKNVPAYEGSAKWYTDYPGAKCVKDCTPGRIHDIPAGVCGTIIEDDWRPLFASARECCTKTLFWTDANRCEGTSTGVPFYTNKFYVDATQLTCRLDCDAGGGLPCGGNPTNPNAMLYDNENDCCQGGIGWVRRSQCIADIYGIPNVGGREWYYRGDHCVQDCPVSGADPKCGGLKDNWKTGYAKRLDCCHNTAVFWNKNCINLPVP